MCDFKPGDEVVVVKGCEALPTLLKGAVHTILDVRDFDDGAGPRVFLQGVNNGSPFPGDGVYWFGFKPSRFRKVQRRDLSAWLNQSVKNTDKMDKRKKADA